MISGGKKLLFVAALVAYSLSCSHQAQAAYGEVRTANRSVKGVIHQFWHRPPAHLGDNYRTWSSAHDHSEQWKNERWDPALWDGKRWTAESVIRGFYDGDVLYSQYIDRKGNAIVKVGPKFYKLTFVDQQRVMRLLAQHSSFSQSGLGGFEVRDWHNGKLVGTFSQDSLSLESRIPISD